MSVTSGGMVFHSKCIAQQPTQFLNVPLFVRGQKARYPSPQPPQTPLPFPPRYLQFCAQDRSILVSVQVFPKLFGLQWHVHSNEWRLLSNSNSFWELTEMINRRGQYCRGQWKMYRQVSQTLKVTYKIITGHKAANDCGIFHSICHTKKKKTRDQTLIKCYSTRK